MDPVDQLIQQFRAEQTANLDNIDHSHKPQIICALEGHADDPRVVAFLLTIAQDEQEYDLARIEVMRVLEVAEFQDGQIRGRIGRAIARILTDSSDPDVRNYAAMAAASYIEIAQLAHVVVAIVRNTKEDSVLRWNAFAALEKAGPSPTSIPVLRELQRDDEFRASASRVLSEWNV